MVIAFDIGNVNIKIDPPGVIQRFGWSKDEVPKYIDLELQMERGEISDAEFFQALKRSQPERSEEELRGLFDSGLLDPIPGMEDLLEKCVAHGIQPVFLSDISDAHLKGFRRRFRNADKYPGVYSYLVGALKPSPLMLGTFEERYGKPDLYVDDRADLIEAAVARGWNAKVFEGAEWLDGILFGK